MSSTRSSANSGDISNSNTTASESVSLAVTPHIEVPSISPSPASPPPANRRRGHKTRTQTPWWQDLRHQGSRGGVIEPHRSLATVAVTRSDILVSVLLSFLITTFWLTMMNSVTFWWEKCIAVWMPLLGLEEGVSRYALPFQFAGLEIRLLVPAVSVTAGTPDSNIWMGCLLGVLLVLLAAQLLNKSYLPMAYLMRWVAFIQCTALIYFALYPGTFAYTLPQYLSGLLLACLTLISLVPITLGLTFYIFNFHIIKKIGLTVCIMGHLIVFAPLQFLLHAYLLQNLSLLFMPLFHLIFGIPILVLIFVSLYAWGMSWQESPGSRS